jgi:outer membrane receptor protein involved in Fe transport
LTPFAALSAAGLAFLPLSMAIAQLVPQGAANTTQLEEVVVTAEKRSESLSKIPLSVSAISSDDLRKESIADFADLSRVVPNVSFSTQAGPGLATIEIRGISSQAGTAAIGVYMDDTSLTTRNLYSQGMAEPRFFDLDRVEVLRGPQGTLYGGGTLGGVIRFVSKPVNLSELSGSVTGEVSDTQHGGTNYDTQGVLNLPLVVGKVALRLGVQQGDDSGYIDQVDSNSGRILARGINNNRWDVVKAALKWQLTDDWSVTPGVFYQKMTSADIDAFYLNPYVNPVTGATLNLAAFQTAKLTREPGTDRLSIPSIKVEGDLGFAMFTAVGSYFHRSFERVQDGTASNVPYTASQVTDPALAQAVAALPGAIDLLTEQKQTSLELRLASKAYDPAVAAPFTWVVGAFYSKDTTDVYDTEPVIGLTKTFQQFGMNVDDPNALAGSYAGAIGPNDSVYGSNRHYNPQQQAIFGELTYHLRPDVAATLGLRYETASERFSREGNYWESGCDVSAGGTGCPSAYAPPKVDFHAVTPRISLAWNVDPNNLVYANVAKGYRLGSFNRPVPLYGSATTPFTTLYDLYRLGLCNGTLAGCANAIPVAFKPDSLWSYELGSKSKLFDGRVTLNTSLFYTKWSDTQQDLELVTSVFDFEKNAGHAQSYGGEVEARARVAEDWTVTLAGGYTRATFTEAIPALGYAQSTGDLNVENGALVPGVPKYNLVAGAEYTHPISGSVTVFAHATGEWTGSSHGTVVLDAPDYARPSYFVAEANTGLDWGSLELTLFAKNLLNTSTIIQRPNIEGVSSGYSVRPRTIGLRATYSFGPK